MIFTQFDFLFLFLPLTFAGYFFISYLIDAPSARQGWLALASLVFYGQWDMSFVPIILLSIGFNYTMGALIARQAGDEARILLFTAAVTVNLSTLGFFKYTNFGIQIFNLIVNSEHPYLAIVLPLGISFFTFTQIAYLADVYGGYPHEKSFAKYTLFVSYFPHLIAGPVLHHREMMRQFSSRASRVISVQKVAVGLTILSIGLFKKSVVADGFALIATPVFQAAAKAEVQALDAWAGALAYALQIYFDFSGYSDMAIGLSLMFGIRLPFNFDAPYKSRSIVEFWRRWHISLSRFLRDYLYVPIGGNRHGEFRRNVNLATVMILGGLWHGAGFTFVIWGGLHGSFLIINHQWDRLAKRYTALGRIRKAWCFPFVAIGLTQLCVAIAWVFFRADSLDTAVRMLQAMTGYDHRSMGSTSFVDLREGIAIVLGYAACLCLPNVNAIFAGWNVGLEIYKNERPWSIFTLTWRPSVAWAVATSLAALAAVVINVFSGDSSQFLYFQF
jgi:alginate O-acetyltransferase complex protein AlgI